MSAKNHIPFHDKSFFSNRSDLELFDSAILPSALAASSYSQNCWAFDVAAGVSDPMARAGEENFAADPGAFSRALMIASCCKPLSADELRIDPTAFGASLERGVWRKGDLASALCCVSTNDDGTRELHLSVRGTDMANNVNPKLAAFQTIVGYFLWTYPRIEKHAKLFEPLAEALRAYAADPANRISKIVVSGHSLGAAAAETLLPQLQTPGIPLSMFGFGSPGTGSGWMAPLKALGALAAKAAERTLEEAASAAASVAAWAARSTGNDDSFVCHVASALEAALITPGSAAPPERSIVQFRHPNDPVPKLGSLLYSTAGVVREALYPTEMIQRFAERTETLAHGIQAHSATRYAESIQRMASKSRFDISPGEPCRDGMRRLVDAKLLASRIEADTPPELLSQAVAKARAANVAALWAKNPSDPSIDRILALPTASEVANRIARNRIKRKFQAYMASRTEFSAALNPLVDGNRFAHSIQRPT